MHLLTLVSWEHKIRGNQVIYNYVEGIEMIPKDSECADQSTEVTSSVVLTDTSTLWTVDSLVNDYGDWRAPECLARLIDVLLDARIQFRCLFQAPNLGENAQKLPLTYEALRKADLLLPETKKTAKDYEILLTDEAMSDFLQVAELWAAANPKYATAFRNLHQHPSVHDPERSKVLSEDGREDAVPPPTYEFCNGPGQARVQQIANTLKRSVEDWSVEDVTFVFAILMRGTQYEYIVHQTYSGKAQYLTHPARWLGGCKDFEVVPDFSSGSAANRLGGKIAHAWICRGKNDISLLLDWVLQARENCGERYDFLDGVVTKPKEVLENVNYILRHLPAEFKDLGTVSGGVAGGGVGGAIGGFLGGAVGVPVGAIVSKFVNSKWARRCIPGCIPKRLARIPILRSVVHHPNLEPIIHVCHRCGTENLAKVCPVCNLDKGSLGH